MESSGSKTPAVLILTVVSFFIWIFFKDFLRIIAEWIKDCLCQPRVRDDEDDGYEPVVEETRRTPMLMRPLLTEMWEPPSPAENEPTTPPLPTTATSEPIWIRGRGPPVMRVFDLRCNVCNAPPRQQEDPQVDHQQEEEVTMMGIAPDEDHIPGSPPLNFCYHHIHEEFASVPVLRRTPVVDVVDGGMSLP